MAGCNAETLICLASFTAKSSISLSYAPRDLQHLGLLQMALGLGAFPLTPHLGSLSSLEKSAGLGSRLSCSWV